VDVPLHGVLVGIGGEGLGSSRLLLSGLGLGGRGVAITFAACRGTPLAERLLLSTLDAADPAEVSRLES
jgi:hypothetical protein